MWLKRLYEEVVKLKEIPSVMVDNEAAIKLAQNPESGCRTKHLRTRHFFIRELVCEEMLDVKRRSATLQLADALTKPIFKPRLEKLRENMS